MKLAFLLIFLIQGVSVYAMDLCKDVVCNRDQDTSVSANFTSATPSDLAAFKTANCTGTLDLGDAGKMDLRSTISMISPTKANMEFEMLDTQGWEQACKTAQPMSVKEHNGIYLLHGDLNCRDGSGKNMTISFDSISKTFFFGLGFGMTFTCKLMGEVSLVY